MEHGKEESYMDALIEVRGDTVRLRGNPWHGLALEVRPYKEGWRVARLFSGLPEPTPTVFLSREDALGAAKDEVLERFILDLYEVRKHVGLDRD